MISSYALVNIKETSTETKYGNDSQWILLSSICNLSLQQRVLIPQRTCNFHFVSLIKLYSHLCGSEL